jgi:hypothetical protein
VLWLDEYLQQETAEVTVKLGYAVGLLEQAALDAYKQVRDDLVIVAIFANKHS